MIADCVGDKITMVNSRIDIADRDYAFRVRKIANKLGLSSTFNLGCLLVLNKFDRVEVSVMDSVVMHDGSIRWGVTRNVNLGKKKKI